MRDAYALLGISFIIVFSGAFILISDKAHAPTPEEINTSNNSTETMSFSLTSPVFQHNESIPSKYTCDGENLHPPLLIHDVPEGAESLVLIMDDPDIPQEIKDTRGISKFNHWAIYNIPADTKEIEEGVTVGTLAQNSTGESAYIGPCPPPEYQPTEHQYVFRVYALPAQLNFIQAPTLDEVETAASSSALGRAELIGRYERIQ